MLAGALAFLRIAKTPFILFLILFLTSFPVRRRDESSRTPWDRPIRCPDREGGPFSRPTPDGRPCAVERFSCPEGKRANLFA
jgi:hypothetical protein